MTDIDALVAEANGYLAATFDNSPYEAKLLSGFIDALTTERAKVTALEAEVARWREVADRFLEIVGSAESIFVNCNVTAEYCVCGSPVDGHSWGDGHSPVDAGEYAVSQWLSEAKAALARFKQESDHAA